MKDTESSVGGVKLVTLRTGKVVPESRLEELIPLIKMLYLRDKITLFDAMIIARDPDSDTWEWSIEALQKKGIVNEDGMMTQVTKDIIVAMTEYTDASETDIWLVDPLPQP